MPAHYLKLLGTRGRAEKGGELDGGFGGGTGLSSNRNTDMWIGGSPRADDRSVCIGE